METLVELGDNFVGEDLLGFQAVRTAEIILELGYYLIDHTDSDPQASKSVKGRVIANRGHGAAGISDDIHVVAKANGIAGGPEQTDIRGEAGEDEVGAARGLECFDQFGLVEAA